MLARLGRAVALLFTLWLLGLLLAGLGILPGGLIPLGHSVGAQSLSRLPSFPAPRLPSKSDLAAAQPLSSPAGGPTAAHGSPAAVAATLTASSLGAIPGQRGAAGHGPGSTSRPVKVAGGKGAGTGGATGVGASQGASPPGQAVSQSSPGHTQPGSGNSGSAPGQIKQTSTTSTTSTSTSPGQSGSAPGQTRTHGTGGGNGY